MRKQGSAAELETRRRLAGQLLLEGRTIGEVMEIVGASESSVKRWKRALKKGGMEALKAKPHPGPKPRLNVVQKRKLLRLPRGGTAKGRLPQRSLDLFASGGSRRQAVSGSLPSLPRLEDSSRPWLDKPEARAAGARVGRRRHRTLAKAGLAADKKGARESLTPLVFLDESGFMLQPVRRRTWAPSGQTPIQKAWDRHERLSAIGIIWRLSSPAPSIALLPTVAGKRENRRPRLVSAAIASSLWSPGDLDLGSL